MKCEDQYTSQMSFLSSASECEETEDSTHSDHKDGKGRPWKQLIARQRNNQYR